MQDAARTCVSYLKAAYPATSHASPLCGLNVKLVAEFHLRVAT